ncbi:MAG: ABC transporter permease [Planctomycetota bacterium]|nr:ABC transporter permease [Planctomycetota bacterium]
MGAGASSPILRRILWMLPTLLGITLVVFLAMHAAPGDPADALSAGELTGMDVTAAAQRMRADQLLDAPLWRQYVHFLGPFDLSPNGHSWFGGSGRERWHGLLALDFGREFQRSDISVGAEIARRAWVTIPLGLAALLLTYAIAIPLGAWSAARAGTRRERFVTLILFLLHAVPVFWLALILVLVFGASGLGWLPAIGMHDKDAATLGAFERVIDTLRHAILPVIALSLGSLAYLSRQTRAGVVSSLREDFVRTARAKGVRERDVLVRHALRHALLPVITLLGTVFPALVAGSVVVETIFDIEGLGRYAFEGVLARDTNIVLATTVVSAVFTMLGILVADLLYMAADPRIRHA